jgi:hypothetical protein
LHGGLPPVEPPLLPELDDEDELEEDDELELDEELLDPPVLLVVVLVMPPVELEVELPLEEVEPPLEEVELPVLELSLSILISTLVAPPLLLLPPTNPPKKPPKPPPKPPEPPITIGWPPPVAMIGCCGSCGSGIGTIAYCSSSQHSRSTTRRMVRSRGGTVRSARRCLTYLGRSVLTILADR